MAARPTGIGHLQTVAGFARLPTVATDAIASEMQRAAITVFMPESAKGQPGPDFYKVLDVAHRIAGTELPDRGALPDLLLQAE